MMMRHPQLALIAALLWAGTCAHGAPCAAGAAVVAPEAEALEKQTLAVAAHCVETTVSLIGCADEKGGISQGSGVVVSADGLILTAAHVLKGLDEVTVRFPDGTVTKAKALGLDEGGDVAMARILDPAPPGGWPHAEVAPADTLKTGEWTLATGNPGGCKLNRPPPLRIGRVIAITPTALQTDCTVISGDSGGPLFDLKGRVVGIHSNISINVHFNRHAPVGVLLAHWRELAAGQAAFTEDGMKPTAGDRENGHASAPRDAKEAKKMAYFMRGAADVFGDAAPDAVKLVAPGVAAAGACMVKVVVDGRGQSKRVGLGTVVGAGGLIVTCADLLPKSGDVSVLLPNGDQAQALFLGSDQATNLALFKVAAHALTCARWVEPADLPIGTWVVAPTAGAPAIGVVSVATRAIPKAETLYLGTSQGMLGIGPRDPFSTVVGDVMRGFPADKAGIKAGDRLLSIAGTAVHTPEEILKAIAPHSSGETLAIEAMRGGEKKTFQLALAGPERVPFEKEERRSGTAALSSMAGRLSPRTTEFPVAVQHDAAIWADGCGGPLLNLRGQVLGVNVSRFDRVGTYAIPAKEVMNAVGRIQKACAAEERDGK